jgi:PAS domain S-box-containing protein
MTERKRFYLLILIMTGVSLAVGGIAVYVLYRTAMGEARGRLAESAQSQARLIEAVARFDAVHSADFPQGSAAATVSQIVDAHKHYKGFGRTGEFTLARRERERIVFLLSHRHYDLENPKPVPWDAELAEPMRRALSGKSGTVIAIDYRGEIVLAAHEPVAELDLGIVAKIDLAEVRAPFVRAALWGFVSAVVVVFFASLLFLRISNPMITRFHEQHARLESIVETAVEAIVTIDQQGVIESFNPAAEGMFGYSADDAIGQDVSLLMPSPYRDDYGRYLARYLKTGEPKIIGIGHEFVGRRKDGSTFPVDLTVSEVDRLGLFTGIIRDITNRKAIEAALRQEHELSESIINTAHAIILVLDTEGRIVRFNPFLEELTGHTLNEVRGKDWFETFLAKRDRTRIRELFQKAANETLIAGNVNPIVTSSGRLCEIRWWAKTLKDGDGNVIGVLSIGQDITELKQAQERLVQSERLSAIGEAMTGLTHESRNALARSQANLRRLARRLKDQPELLALIEAAIMAQEDLRQLFEEVRQYAAPIQLQCKLSDVGRLIGETWEQLAPSREGREAILQQARAGFNLECEIDTFHVGNAIRNILENALSACEDPVEIDINYSEVQIKGRPFLRITILDNGPGLESEQADRVFDAFYTTKTQGTGLGLAIVKRTVEQHGGELANGSDARGGAEFTLTLPRKQQ